MEKVRVHVGLSTIETLDLYSQDHTCTADTYFTLTDNSIEYTLQ